MTQTTISFDQTDEALFAIDVSDRALELAAGHKGGAMTVSYCSGLDSCPAEPAA
jgi:hypothetical protein